MLKNENIPKAALHLYSKRDRLYTVGNWAPSAALDVVSDSCICELCGGKCLFLAVEICRKTIRVSAALYPVVHTDPGLGDPVVQSAPQHHPGCRARVGERWDGWDKTTAGSGSPWAYLGSGRAVGLHSENKRPGQGTECLFLRKSFDKRSEVKLVSEFFLYLTIIYILLYVYWTCCLITFIHYVWNIKKKM